MTKFWWIVMIVLLGAIIAGSLLTRQYLKQQGLQKENIVDRGNHSREQ